MRKTTKILGISAYYHDSAACLIIEGKIKAAAQEERFTRKKHDQSFPINAIRYCLEEGETTLSGIDKVVFYEKPFVKFERLLETYLGFAPRGFRSFVAAMPVWLKEKLFLKHTLQKELKKHFGKEQPPTLFAEHHQSHAASAFYPSPFQEAAVLCLDGVGEWTTTSAWHGEGNELNPLWEIRFPHSLGLLYSAFTYYTGFKVNSGEYKVMGLAPYGHPTYVQTILDHLIDIKEDGTFRLNMEYFNYCTGLTMTNRKFSKLFGGGPRKGEATLTQREMDMARSVQEVIEEVVIRLARSLQKETGLRSLCLAGGVALNCVANGRLLKEGPFESIWIQPAAGDAGGALGAALAVWHSYQQNPRVPEKPDGMHGSYLGTSFSNGQIQTFLEEDSIPFEFYADDDLYRRVAKDLATEKVVGWFQGRMEFGPRSLGARSIIGDARSPKMQSVMNLKIKYRESFRPFAPSVLRERVADYFELDHDSPYMLLVAPVKQERRIAVKESEGKLWGIDLLKVPRSDIPAVTHVDYSARIQTVHEATNPCYYRLLKEFEGLTGYGVIVNTSFNVRGEPIVCTPEDAYRCFMRTEMDTLVLENFVLNKIDQPKGKLDDSWKEEFDLD
jgi:carbamoyltransferase